MLKSLERDLLEHGTPENVQLIEIDESPIRIRIDIESMSCHRTTFLTPFEFELLCELASSPKRVFSRDQLLSNVWGYDYFGDGRVVDAHIRRLRKKIEDEPSDPAFVLTVRGLGYKFMPPDD